MLEHVHAAVYAGPLAVPHAEDPVVTSFGEEGGLLTAPYGGGGKLLVDARLKVDVVTIEKGLRLPHGLIDSPKRAASISGDESCRVEPSCGIPLVLQHRQSHQRFNASHIGPGLVQSVFIVQRYDFEKRCFGLPHDAPCVNSQKTQCVREQRAFVFDIWRLSHKSGIFIHLSLLLGIKYS